MVTTVTMVRTMATNTAMTTENSPTSSTGISRRQLLTRGAVGVGALAVGAAAGYAGGRATPAAAETFGGDTIPFYGPHQRGVAVPPQAHVALLGFTLRADTDREQLRGMMRLLTDDAARLTSGRTPLADIEAELTDTPARLTITFGFGAEFVRRVGAKVPDWLKPLPAFEIDDLREEYSGGDFLIDIAGDDPITVAHAQRILLRDTRTFAVPAWTQKGFRRARGTEDSGRTMRNLFGQIDGTINPQFDSEDFDEVVWIDDGTWMTGGTAMILRRIAMNMDTWDKVDRIARENAIGRRLKDGGPLTGGGEFDAPDFDARDELGFHIIDTASHMRRARPVEPGERIYRRGYNYDEAMTPSGSSDTGLLFIAYQADIEKQYIPIQQRLAEADLMNIWTTPIGSSVFAIPPGCNEGGFIGEGLFDAV